VEPFLATAHLAKRFGPCLAVDDVSVDVGPSERLVIVGASGSGKTTLLRLIAGLERPDAGEIRIGGHLVARTGQNLIPPHERGIGFVFQDLALWPHLTIREHIEFGLRSWKLQQPERRTRAQELLDLVRLEPLSAKYPHQISGGEQQRAALARALAGGPRLLLLDEPFSNLDPELRAALREELIRLQDALSISAIYVTHDREDAAVLADRIIEMRNGRVVMRSVRSTQEAL
jgi:iron(III) transport system ATP-binding protein